MAAVANEFVPNAQGLITINVEAQRMDVSDFIRICRGSYKYKTNKHAIILVFRGVSYHCSVNLNWHKKPLNFLIRFHNTDNICEDSDRFVIDSENNTNMMYLSIIDNLGNSELTTRLPFSVLPGLDRLKSLMYMRCRFYAMINHRRYKITDTAKGLCNGTTQEYPIFLYRVLYRRQNGTYYPINELSIYYKFFTRYYHSNESDKYGELIDFTNPKYQTMVQEFRASMVGYPYITKRSGIIPFSQTSDNCVVQGKHLNDLSDSLDDHPEWKLLDKNLINYIVDNVDCKYYPGNEWDVELNAADAARLAQMTAVDRASPRAARAPSANRAARAPSANRAPSPRAANRSRSRTRNTRRSQNASNRV
jgi:hypothetical protein